MDLRTALATWIQRTEWLENVRDQLAEQHDRGAPGSDQLAERQREERQVREGADAEPSHASPGAGALAEALLGAPAEASEVVARAPAPGLVALAADVRHLHESSKAQNTRRAYAADWRSFEAWARGQGFEPLPPSGELVALYVASLSREGLRVSTIERAVSGIASTFRERGFSWTAPVVLTDTVRGLRRVMGTKKQKKHAATDDVLRKMLGTFEGTVADARDRALLTIGWCGALRRSEIVALDVEDVTFVPEGLVLQLRRSKTDQEGKGTERGLPRAEDPALCPSRSLRTWLDVAGIASGAIFRPVTSEQKVKDTRLSASAVAELVKRAAREAGFDAREFSGHSLRAGFVTTAAKRGRGLDEIMRQTGHRSEHVAREYIRHATLFDRNETLL
jgi:integrase